MEPLPSLESIATRIRQLVAGSALSQERIANAVGVSQSIISKWMRAERRPNYQHAKALAAFFGVDVHSILEPTEQPG